MVGRDREDGKSCKATSPFQSPYSKAQWNSEHSLLTKSVEKYNFMQLFCLRTLRIYSKIKLLTTKNFLTMLASVQMAVKVGLT